MRRMLDEVFIAPRATFLFGEYWPSAASLRLSCCTAFPFAHYKISLLLSIADNRSSIAIAVGVVYPKVSSTPQTTETMPLTSSALSSLLILVLFVGAGRTQLIASQQAALLEIIGALRLDLLPTGAWNISQLSNACMYGWRGLFCSPTNSSVEAVIWSGAGPSGTFPTALGNLTTLKSLTIDNLATISGPIPVSLGLLTQLQALSLRSLPNVGGGLPVQLFNATRMAQLEIHDVPLTGTIPTEISRLSVLSKLSISKTSLSGSIPGSLSSLTQLATVSIEVSNLNGTIPSWSHGLVQLKLWTPPGIQSRLTPISIPNWLRSMRQLEFLQLAGTRLTGAIPSWLFDELPELLGLDLSVRSDP